ncbi:HET-domain-containing protein, partial [Melanomma pulvis-pyrius CBS 109.77]
MSCNRSPDCYNEPLLPGSIRLLRLLPNEDKGTPIRCELFHYALQQSNKRTHLYDALSYVWGGSDKPRSIFIRQHIPTSGCDFTSEFDLPVTENLHAALLRLRDHYIERIIWIDAVCINQKDEREKEIQILLMAKIYAQASRVIVWLGEAADGSDQVLQAIRMAGGQELGNALNDEMTQQAVIALLQRPWFRRIWILQEVAAARHILIMCGPTEIDGHAFCLGIDSFKGFDKVGVDLRSFIHSVTYLISGAIFRPGFSISRSGRSSLEICPLGELMDMYYDHEATQRHDKVYALLGMSSDDLSKTNLLPDYKVPWEELLQRLVKYLLCEEISVETGGCGGEIVAIKSKGYILGQVFLEESYTSQNSRNGVDVNFKNSEGSARWTLQISAKSIQNGDIVCLLQGASKPTIIRPCQDYFRIIKIAARTPETIPIGGGYIEWPKLFLPGIPLTARDLLLIWDWENSLEKFPYLE